MAHLRPGATPETRQADAPPLVERRRPGRQDDVYPTLIPLLRGRLPTEEKVLTPDSTNGMAGQAPRTGGRDLVTLGAGIAGGLLIGLFAWLLLNYAPSLG